MIQDIAFIRERVAALKDHPALLSWLLYGEPEIQIPKIPPENLASAYRAIKEIDPLHPVSIDTASEINEVAPYFNSFDIAMPQWLMVPLSYAIGEKKVPLTKELETLTSLNKSFIHHVYVYNVARDRLICKDGANSDFEGCKQGYPTTNDIRSMSYYAIIKGTKGLAFNCYRFNYNDSDPGGDVSPKKNPSQWQAISSVSSELKSLGSIFLAPKSQVQVTAAPANVGVEFILKDYKNGLYLIAMNTKEQERTVTFTFSVSPTAVKVLNESRTIIPQGNSFTDVFAGYGVHVYEIQ